MAKRKKVRLVAAQVTFQFVVDDGDTLTPLVINDNGTQGPPSVNVPAAEWPDYSRAGYLDALAKLEDQVNAQAEADSARSER